MDSDDFSPESVIEKAQAELAEVVAHYRRSGNAERILADLGRWKRRTSNILREHVSEEEARAFDMMDIHPSWVRAETMDGPVRRHREFLASLLDEVRRYPPRRRAVASASRGEPATGSRARYAQPSPTHAQAVEAPVVARADNSLVGTFNRWVEKEYRVRGRLWGLIGVVLALLFAALGLFR